MYAYQLESHEALENYILPSNSEHLQGLSDVHLHTRVWVHGIQKPNSY
jgi:hypothetical protein